MTKEPTRRRRLLAGRRPAAPRRAPVPPVEVPERPSTGDVSRDTSEATVHPLSPPEEPSRPALDSEAVALLQEAPPQLPRQRAALLEELTAIWSTQARIAGSGADATMFYAAARPPVPPSARDLPPVPTEDEEDPPARVSDEPPARVSDWSSRHDPRSLEFAVRARLARPVPLQDFLLERGPVLDQGTTPPLSAREASACVGMAVVAAANALDLDSRPVYSRPAAEGLLGVEEARAIYARAQHLDHVSGEAYAGTSVLAGMKAGQEAGYWSTYLWALGGTRDIAQALLQLRSPIVVGLPWTTGLEEPDPAGVIAPGGSPAGGHALTVVGLRLQHAGRSGPWFVLQQSRGTTEGAAGLVYLHHSHLGQLLAGVGEAAVPLSRWAMP